MIFFIFFLQNHEMRPETESRNSGDHELWYHEMQGSPVIVALDWKPGLQINLYTF